MKGRHVTINGQLARVNWHRNGFMGITYVGGPSKGFSNTIPETDVDHLPDTESEKNDLSNLSEEELRERLIDLRRSRRTPKEHKPAKPRKAKAKKDSGKGGINLNDLTPEQKKMAVEILKQMLGGKKNS